MRCSERRRAVAVTIGAETFEQEATEGTEIGSILRFLRYLLLDF